MIFVGVLQKKVKYHVFKKNGFNFYNDDPYLPLPEYVYSSLHFFFKFCGKILFKFKIFIAIMINDYYKKVSIVILISYFNVCIKTKILILSWKIYDFI